MFVFTEGTPRYVGEDDCTYLFEWPTKYACIGTKEQQCTVSDHNGHMYDLSILSRVKSDSSLYFLLSYIFSYLVSYDLFMPELSYAGPFATSSRCLDCQQLNDRKT